MTNKNKKKKPVTVETKRVKTDKVLAEALRYTVLNLIKCDEPAAEEDVLLDAAARDAPLDAAARDAKAAEEKEKAAEEEEKGKAWVRSAVQIRAILDRLSKEGEKKPLLPLLSEYGNRRGGDLLQKIGEGEWLRKVTGLNKKWATALHDSERNEGFCGMRDFLHLGALVHLVDFEANARVDILERARMHLLGQGNTAYGGQLTAFMSGVTSQDVAELKVACDESEKDEKACDRHLVDCSTHALACIHQGGLSQDGSINTQLSMANIDKRTARDALAVAQSTRRAKVQELKLREPLIHGCREAWLTSYLILLISQNGMHVIPSGGHPFLPINTEEWARLQAFNVQLREVLEGGSFDRPLFAAPPHVPASVRPTAPHIPESGAHSNTTSDYKPVGRGSCAVQDFFF